MSTQTHNSTCTAHDSDAWSHHRVWTSLSAVITAPAPTDGAFGPAGVIATGQAAAAALAARDAAVPNSGRNGCYATGEGIGIAPTVAMLAAHRAVNASARMRAALGIVAVTPPSQPVTVAALVARRRNVRSGRYEAVNAAMRPMTLPGVAYASTGEQVLTDAAITWSDRATDTTVRSGHCHAPTLVDLGDGTVAYKPAVETAAAKVARRKTPETATKEILKAIGNVATNKRPESWARDRLHKYAELLDVDVYDDLVDQLDVALIQRPFATAVTPLAGEHVPASAPVETAVVAPTARRLMAELATTDRAVTFN